MIWMGAIILLLGSHLFVYVPLIFLRLFTLPHRVNILSLVYINDLHCEFLLLQTVSNITSVSPIQELTIIQYVGHMTQLQCFGLIVNHVKYWI